VTPVGSDPYDAIAVFYDLGMSGFDDDVGLYLGFARRTGGRILELGCGTGRLLDPLAGEGFDVVGVDRSAPMLAQAYRRPASSRGTVRLLQASICPPPLSGRFGLVILALGTFLHLSSAEDQRSCLLAARALLDRDGLLVIDLPAVDAPGWEDWSPGVRPLVLAWSGQLRDGTRVDKLSTFSADPSTQSHHVTEFYDSSAAGGHVRRTVVEYSLRFVFPSEMELLLDSVGLTLVDRYGDYDLGPFVPGSGRQIYVAAAGAAQS
jgi:SAM-dependent methyltransferase